MSMSIKKRLALGAGSVATIGAVATLVAGVTFGLFSATEHQTGGPNTFATGTVSSTVTSTSTVCTVTNMVPGDNSTNYVTDQTGRTNTKLPTCEFQVTYTGSAPAYVGLAATFSDTPSASTLSGNLLWQIQELTTSASGAQTEPTQPGVYTTAGVINTNTSSNPLYVAKDPGTLNSGGKTYTFWVDYALPSSVTDQALTGPASLTLTVYEVQSGNNGDGVCTVGAECLGSGHINSWS